jgi:transcription antitermination factor NusG
MNTVNDGVSPWYVLQTLPRCEKKVVSLLRQKGYECFSPTYQEKRRWSDRVVTKELPLFSSYVFCRFNSSVLGRALVTPGVKRIVAFGGKPAEVPEEEIEALQLLVASDLLRKPWAYLPHGTMVKVETGPLTGVMGIICSGGNKRCLVISVTLLLRSVAVQLDDNTVVSVIEKPKKKAAAYNNSDIVLKLMNRARMQREGVPLTGPYELLREKERR